MTGMASIKAISYRSVTGRLDENEKKRGKGKIRVDCQVNLERSCNFITGSP